MNDRMAAYPTAVTHDVATFPIQRAARPIPESYGSYVTVLKWRSE